MSLFGKLVVVVLLATGAYIFWPRQAARQNFVPEKIAAYELAAWRSLQSGATLQATGNYYLLYTTQFNLSPVAAFHLATTQVAAIAGLLRAKDPAAQDVYEPNFIEAATLFCREVATAQDGPSLGRSEFHVWGALAENLEEKKLVPLVESQLAHWSGVPAASLQRAAEMRARALHMVFGGEAKTVDWELVHVQLTGAWGLVKDLLPPSAPKPGAP